MVLQIGVRLRRVAAREGTELRRRHAHGAGAFEGVLDADFGFAPQRIGGGVEGGHALDFEDGANLQMVLQVAAHTGQIVLHLNAVLLQ